ncbi:uncharacterized protein LOC135332127 isoform X3 [Halichondria panicea]|uniref:uncharacterized protein LOC135332127 isoform X3 n=1 Tax=Halichondria panicea TaxID=6063 RepID=UPI00312B2D8C
MRSSGNKSAVTIGTLGIDEPLPELSKIFPRPSWQLQACVVSVLINPLMYRVYQILVTIGYILCPIGTSGSLSASAYASNFVICPVPVVDLSWTGLFPCDLGWRGSALVVAIVSVVFLVSYLFIRACLTRWNPRRIIKQIVNCTVRENERKRERDKFDVSLVTFFLTPVLSFSLVVFSHHLLLQCGDVESNPGPGNIGYERMVSCAEKIVEGLSRDPRGLATPLSARGLISDTIMMQTLILNETRVYKARRLFTTVLEAVKLNPWRYNDFLAILREHGEVYTDLLEMLEIKEKGEATTESEPIPSEEEVEAKRQHLNAMNEKIHQSDLKQVYELVSPAMTVWFNLGIALGLSSSKLLGIEENNVIRPDKYLMKMLEIVLYTNTNLTWSGLCEALRTPSVARNYVAEDIEAMIRTKRKSPILRNDGNSEEGLKIPPAQRSEPGSSPEYRTMLTISDKLLAECRSDTADIEVVRGYLEQEDCDVNIRDDYWERSPLMWALNNKHFDIAKLLLQYKPQVRIQDMKGMSPLVLASRAGDLEIVQGIVALGAEINLPTNGRTTPLMWAARVGHAEVVTFLLEKGAFVDFPDLNGWTPVMVASQEGHVDVVNILLKYDAKANHKSNIGTTALSLGAKYNHPDVVKVLESAMDIANTNVDESHSNDSGDEDSEQDKYLQRFNELMEDTEQIDMQYLKLYLIGLPGVGKTTFRKRLTRSLVNISSLPLKDRQHYSTHLAECIQTLCILQDEKHFDVEISESLDDEMKAIFKYLLGNTEMKEPAPTDSDSTQAIHSEGPLDSNTSQEYEGSSTQLDSSPVGESNETTEPTEKDETKSKLSRVLAEIREVVASGNYADFILRHKILLNIIDIGGQPGFLEMLPFICGGPGIFFVFFPLDKEFDEQYQICYQRDEDRITPYEANYSIRETIAQILSGISYHTSEILPINDKYKQFTSVKPTITLIGTFKDELERQMEKEVRDTMQQQVSGSEVVQQQNTVSEQGATKTRQRLEELHKSVKETTSKSYFSDFVVPANARENKIFFEVDNYEGDDKDLEPIRAHIRSCLRDNKGSMKVPIRPVQLLFSIILRKEYQIVKLEDCMKIGNELNMDEDTVDFTLWFFNQLGTIIYRPEIGGWFKDNVICSPQVIFNSISTLIIEPLLKLHRSEERFVKKHHDNWEKGQFLLETIKKSLPSSGDDLTVIPLENLIIFLKHVHLISSIEAKEVNIRGETSVVRYFMPAILDCATQAELLTAPVPNNDTPVSLLLFFKYGSSKEVADSVPIGLFCAMIAKLVSDGDEDIFGAEWKLVDSRVKRNIVSFHVDDYNHVVTLVSHAGCYEIRVTRSGLQDQDAPIDLHDLCTYVYTTIMAVLKNLNHFVCPTIGFICPCGQHQDTSLRVLDNSCVIVVPKRDSAFFRCLKAKKNFSLINQQYYHPWITKETNGNREVVLKAFPFDEPDGFSFSWSGKGSLKQLSTTTNELCIQAAESGDYYKCCVKKEETASFTVHHFIKTDCHGSRKHQMSSTISDVSESTADGPSRPKKQKLTAATGTEKMLSPTGEEVVAKRDDHSPVSCQMNQWIFSTSYETVQELLWPATSKWYNLGTALKVDRNKLASIKKSNPNNCEDCFNDMLKSCSETNTSLTWTDVCKALRTSTVARNDVAEKIEQYFVRDE